MVVDRAEAPAGHAAPRRSARQEHRHRRHQLRGAAGPHHRARRRRRGRGRRALAARVRRCRRSGFWFAPTVFTGVGQSHRIAREEIFGPVLSVLTFRTPDEAVAKANNTPYGLSAGVWTEKGSRILVDGRRSCGPAWCGPTRSTGSTRRRRSAATRSRASAARAAATASAPYLRVGRLMAARLDVRKTYKLYVGGDVPAVGERAGRTRSPTPRAASWPTPPGLAQGRPRRRRRGPRRVRRVVRRDRLQPRPGALPRGRDAGGPARAVRRPRWRRPRG